MYKSVFLLSFLLVSPQVSAQGVSAPKPTIYISLERQAIREDDCVPVEIWFSNDDKHELNDVVLQIASPSFIKLDEKSCGAKEQNLVKQIKLDAGQSPSIYHQTLYLKTGPDITVGDYTLLFTFQYRWKLEKEAGHSMLSVEKPVKVNFFGSESVAGVPLGLAGLIVPGLFFWLVVRLFGVSWGMETALGDKLIYSVVMSFIFVALASILIRYASWLRYLDVSSGISIAKLIRLAGTGAAAGAVVGAVEMWHRKRREKNEAKARINFDDDDVAMLGKLLKRNPNYNPSRLARLVRKFLGREGANYRPQTIVQLKGGGDQYIGSLGVKEADLTTLAGWFKITKDKSQPEVVRRLEELERRGYLFDLLEQAKAANFKIEGRNRVKKKAKGGTGTTPAGEWIMPLPSDQILQVVEKANEPGAEPPLSLV